MDSISISVVAPVVVGLVAAIGVLWKTVNDRHKAILSELKSEMKKRDATIDDLIARIRELENARLADVTNHLEETRQLVSVVTEVVRELNRVWRTRECLAGTRPTIPDAMRSETETAIERKKPCATHCR